MWPMTTWPSAVAGPVAAKALQCDSWGRVGPCLGRLAEPPALQPRRRGVEGTIKERGLDVGVERDDIEQVDGPPVELGPGRGRTVGDPLHLLEVLGVESSAGTVRWPASAGRARRRPAPWCCDTWPARSMNRAISGAIKRPC